jgi:hypothetical protein
MNAKPCPFCGLQIDPNDIDTLYPSGIGWKEDIWDGEGNVFRHYVSIHKEELPREQWCYKIVCNEHYGGCGAQMSGDSKEETLQKWNKRT